MFELPEYAIDLSFADCLTMPDLYRLVGIEYIQIDTIINKTNILPTERECKLYFMFQSIYSLYLYGKIYFYKIIKLLPCCRVAIIKYVPRIENNRFQPYNGMIFKKDEILDNIDVIKQEVFKCHQANKSNNDKFSNFFQEYPEIGNMFELYRQGKEREEIIVILKNERHASRQTAAFMAKEDLRQITDSRLRQIADEAEKVCNEKKTSRTNR